MLKASLGAALAAILALSAAAAGAQTVTQPSHLTKDMAGFNGAPDSLTTMISRIERGAGGKVIEIRFTNVDGLPGYRAVVARGDGHLAFMRIVAANGDAVELSQSSVPEWMLQWRDRQAAEIGRQAGIPLDDAIVTAEKAQGGAPAVAAGVARGATDAATDIKAYNVLVYRDGNIVRVAVDGDTNMVIRAPSALANWP